MVVKKHTLTSIAFGFDASDAEGLCWVKSVLTQSKQSFITPSRQHKMDTAVVAAGFCTCRAAATLGLHRLTQCLKTLTSHRAHLIRTPLRLSFALLGFRLSGNS